MNAEPFAPFSPDDRGGVRANIPPWLRTVLAGLCDQLEQILRTEDPASDPAVARLFPAAYPDDPLRELDYERLTSDRLARERLDSVQRMRDTLDAERLDEAHALAWLRTLNDVRLVLGNRLEVTEESEPGDFAHDAIAADTFDLYALLGDVQGLLLLAIDPGAVEPEHIDAEGPTTD